MKKEFAFVLLQTDLIVFIFLIRKYIDIMQNQVNLRSVNSGG